MPYICSVTVFYPLSRAKREITLTKLTHVYNILNYGLRIVQEGSRFIQERKA